MLAQKYAKLVTSHGALYDNRVVWIKMEGIDPTQFDSKPITLHPGYGPPLYFVGLPPWHCE